MSSQQNIFERINNAIRNVEGSIVNLISGIVPWLAPIPAAYMSYQHMMSVLNFPNTVAVPVAIVIEVLGFATVSTILTFWSYNRKYTDEKRQAPVGLTAFAFVFYLSIVLVMNVLIDATIGTEWAWLAVIAVRALLTLMSIPAALVLAVRTQHQEVLNSADEDKRIRAFKKQYGDKWFEMMYGKPVSSQGSQNPQRTKEPSPKVIEVKQYISDYFSDNGTLPKLEEIMVACAVVKSYASKLRGEWVAEHPEVQVRVDTV